jgi:hypothetical protein
MIFEYFGVINIKNDFTNNYNVNFVIGISEKLKRLVE